MSRTLPIIALAALGACGGPQKAAPAGGAKPSCEASSSARATVQKRYDKARDTTVLRLAPANGCFAGADTALVVAASFKGREVAMAPEELMLGLLSRSRAFRLASCTSLSIEAEGAKTPMLAERVPEIGSGGILREFVLGPIPLQTFLRLQGAQLSRVSACDISHEVRPDEREALKELLKKLDAL